VDDDPSIEADIPLCMALRVDHWKVPGASSSRLPYLNVYKIYFRPLLHRFTAMEVLCTAYQYACGVLI
jgi:hypothetical protein